VVKFRPGKLHYVVKGLFSSARDVFVPLDVTTRASIDTIYRRVSLSAEFSMFEIDDAVMFIDSGSAWLVALRNVT
jgi:hypothetical protein